MLTFREIADHAGGELAVTREIKRARELEPDLLEIMAVPRRIEIATHLAQRELKVVRRAGLAFHQHPIVDQHALELPIGHRLKLVALNDLHARLLISQPPDFPLYNTF